MLERSPSTNRAAPSVLLILDTLTDNGSLRWAGHLSRLWAAANWRVGWFSLKSHSDGHPLLPPEDVSLTYGDSRGARFRTALPRVLPRVVRAAAQSDVVLVVSEVGLSVPLGCLAARLVRRPFVVYVQSVPDHSFEAYLTPLERRIWRRCLVGADALLCVSQVAAESAVGLGASPERITIARPGLDVADVRERALEVAAAESLGGVPSLVACGELHHRKGFDLLIGALASVKQSGRALTIRLVGQGADRPALARLAEELGVSDSIEFLGHLANPLPEIARAFAFVHSARVEAIGLVLLEAVALKVPVIAADCEAGGPRMVLAGGRFGRLVEPNSVSALAEAIIAHLDDPTALRSSASEGAQYLRQHFSPDHGAATCLEVFSKLRESSRLRREKLWTSRLFALLQLAWIAARIERRS